MTLEILIVLIVLGVIAEVIKRVFVAAAKSETGQRTALTLLERWLRK